MGAIVLDTSKVNSYVLPSLTKTKNTMQDAYSTSVSLRNSLPSSFNYRSTVNEIANQIYNIRREISDIDTMISKKMESAKSIESKSESRASSISSLAAKIGGIAGTVAGAAVGASTGGVVGTAVGAVVGNKVGSAVGKGLANTGAKVVNGATKVAKSIWNGIKDIGKSIWNGCKKVARKVASFVQKAVSGLVKAAKAVWQGLKWVWNEVIVRTAATIVNVVVSLVEGIVSFIEAIGDLVLLVVGGVCSIFTFISDLIQGIATGEWKWSATSAVWKKWIMPWVGYDWTSKAFEWQGKWVINDLAYKPFKRGETGAKIVKGVGYVVGIIVLSIVTAGGGGAAVSAASAASSAGTSVTAAVTSSLATTMASNTAIYASTALAGAAKAGQSAQNSYNSLSEEEKQSGKAIGKVLASSAVKGGVEAATWYITYGNGAKNLAASNSKIVSKSGLKNLGTTLGKKTEIATTAKFASKTGLKTIVLPTFKASSTKAGIQAGKEYVNAAADTIVTGEYDLAATTEKALISAGTSVAYDYTFGSLLSNSSSGLKNLSAEKAAAAQASVPLDEGIESVTSNNSIIQSASVAMEAVNSAGGKKIVGKAIKDGMKEVAKGIIE